MEDEEVLTETEVGDDGNIYLPGGPVPEAVKRMRAKGLDRASNAAYDGENQKGAVDYEQGGIESGNEETGDNEKFSVEDEETLAEFALGDDGHIYLPAHNGSITDAARHMYIHRNTYIYRLEKIKTLLGTPSLQGPASTTKVSRSSRMS